MSRDKFQLKMELPLDEDGFLRRECPHCEQQFKWRPTQSATQKPPELDELPAYYCPLCGGSAKADAWWTQEQIEHATSRVKAEVLGPALNNFQSNLRRLNRPGSGFRITADPVQFSAPAPFAAEPNDMRVVTPSCHPHEPIKVPENWETPVHCLVCGRTTTEGGNTGE